MISASFIGKISCNSHCETSFTPLSISTSPAHQMKLCLLFLFIGYHLTNKPRTKPKQNINHSTLSATAEIRVNADSASTCKAAPG